LKALDCVLQYPDSDGMEKIVNINVPIIAAPSVTSTLHGNTDDGLDEAVSKGCVTVRYDFRPVSVDYAHGTASKTEMGEAQIQHQHKHNADSQAIFRGTAASAQLSDYVLKFDGERFIMEKLTETIGVKYIRPEDVKAQDVGRQKRTRAPRATIVAAAKKQKKKREAALAAAQAKSSENQSISSTNVANDAPVPSSTVRDTSQP